LYQYIKPKNNITFNTFFFQKWEKSQREDRSWYKGILCKPKVLKSRLVTKQSKLKLYSTVIRPIVTYASETWVLKETIIHKLVVFEGIILRRIFGPTKENKI